LFYECHDTLEEVWSGLRGEPRSFVQGLIQLAVAFYHLGNGNRTGAVRLLGRGLERLAAYPAVYAGLDTGPLRAEAERWRAALLSGTALPEEPPPAILPAGPVPSS
jgi:predicted metal-dependent hydrolase